jgi:hypothetical protein
MLLPNPSHLKQREREREREKEKEEMGGRREDDNGEEGERCARGTVTFTS